MGLGGGYFSSPLFTVPRSPTERHLEAKVASMRATLDDLAKEKEKTLSRLKAEQAGHESDQGRVDKLLLEMAREREALQREETFLRYKGRIADAAFEMLGDVDSTVAQALRPDAEIEECWVVSVDIRRSTELMLKAKSARHFSAFVTDLCHALRRIIVTHYGVFDKFTGDGILSFFPKRYAGDAVASWVVRAADACHEAFRSTYEASRSAFRTVIDTGLGIGVDVGRVRLVDIGDGVSVVGDPVVYACRLGSARAGETLVNQTAAELLTERCYGEVGLES
ncbi:MAG: adenylate/guanylate cyclase domain-containing protein, partial [Planctomycetota bacterium]